MIKVEHLYVKTKKGEPVKKEKSIILQENLGVLGSVCSLKNSPRQVLIVFKDDLKELGIQSGLLKENIVLSGIGSQDVNSGDVIKVNNQTLLRLTFFCEPCNYLAPYVNIPLNKIGKRRGILATVISSGEIIEHDEAVHLKNIYSAIPYRPIERFYWLIEQMPKGKVISYEQIVLTCGFSKAYLRVLPSFIKQSIKDLPVHRIVNSKGELIKYVPQQTCLLKNEGIEISNNSVELNKYLWVNNGVFIQKSNVDRT